MAVDQFEVDQFGANRRTKMQLADLRLQVGHECASLAIPAIEAKPCAFDISACVEQLGRLCQCEENVVDGEKFARLCAKGGRQGIRSGEETLATHGLKERNAGHLLTAKKIGESACRPGRRD